MVILPSPEDYVLVYGPEEDCTTVLYISSMVELSPLVVSEPCTLQIAKEKSYCGVMVGTGMLHTIIILCEYMHYLIITDIIH